MRRPQLQERDFRLEWGEKIGMGFELPGLSVVEVGPGAFLRFLASGEPTNLV